jgi:hypothetical protein
MHADSDTTTFPMFIIQIGGFLSVTSVTFHPNPFALG